MSDFYAKAAATALRLLTKRGKDVTLRTVTIGAYDPATSSAAETLTDVTRKAIFFDFDRINFGQNVRDGTQIQQGDRQCLMDANGDAPTPTSRIIDGETDYTIVDIKELNPAGTPVLYDLWVRR